MMKRLALRSQSYEFCHWYVVCFVLELPNDILINIGFQYSAFRFREVNIFRCSLWSTGIYYHGECYIPNYQCQYRSYYIDLPSSYGWHHNGTSSSLPSTDPKVLFPHKWVCYIFLCRTLPCITHRYTDCLLNVGLYTYLTAILGLLANCTSI